MPRSRFVFPDNSSLYFVRMTGPPPQTRQQGFIEVRPGVNNYAAWLEATRGPVWNTETFVDSPTFQSAIALYRAYEAIVYGDPVAIDWCGWYDPSWRYLVIDVRTPPENSIQQTLASAGGLTRGSKAYVRAQWTLLPFTQTA